ncbi:MAG: CRISPR-associated endonuclease Cas1, partial [Victivallaceae bacterium]
SLAIAKKMFASRFPDDVIVDKSLTELMTLEGSRVKSLYAELANRYFVQWQGRSYTPGNFEVSDLTNKLITACNTALYALVTSIVYSLGLSPRIGFVHSGSPLPFVYDIADLYKADLVFDLAFSLTSKMAGVYNRAQALEGFRQRVIATKFMSNCPQEILSLLGIKK